MEKFPEMCTLKTKQGRHRQYEQKNYQDLNWISNLKKQKKQKKNLTNRSSGPDDITEEIQQMFREDLTFISQTIPKMHRKEYFHTHSKKLVSP